jgi:nitroreductase
MEVQEALLGRRSIRAFRPDTIPAAVIRDILDLARWAPSFANTQPWEFTVVGGGVLAELRRRLREAAAADPQGKPELPWPDLSEKYHARRKAVGLAVFKALNLPVGDKTAKEEWRLQGVGFFNAPHLIVISMDACFSAWGMYDVGAVAQTIMLAAHARGLGTCPQAAPIRHPWVFREVLGMPPDKQVVLAMPFGYPEPDAPVNRFQRTRVPLDEILGWRGFTPEA